LDGGYCFAEAWRLGGVAGTAADLLPQTGQFGCQGGVLAALLIVLLLLSQDESSDGNRCR
ncbi:MAG: hypothetical protein ACKO8I_03130, partial [Cyanobacteriota bacterium]